MKFSKNMEASPPSQEEEVGLVVLGDLFGSVRRRLIAEGYTIEPNKIYRKSDIIGPNEEDYD